MDIWGVNEHELVTISGLIFRTVESQERIATNHLVATLDEQAALEEMIDATKPMLVERSDNLHYLLATPFRYPPLPYGSRFGSARQRGIFYGALSESTVLAEDAYYRLVFRYHAEHLRHRNKKRDQRTMIGANYHSNQGIKLHAPPFNRYRKQLRSPDNYDATQRLGTAMRAAGVAAFEYESARDPAAGINVGLYTPDALASKRPIFQHNLLVQIHDEGIDYFNTDTGNVHNFKLDAFIIDGKLPVPAG